MTVKPLTEKKKDKRKEEREENEEKKIEEKKKEKKREEKRGGERRGNGREGIVGAPGNLKTVTMTADGWRHKVLDSNLFIHRHRPGIKVEGP